MRRRSSFLIASRLTRLFPGVDRARRSVLDTIGENVSAWRAQEDVRCTLSRARPSMSTTNSLWACQTS